MRGCFRRPGRIRKPAAAFGALMFLSAAAAGPAAAQQQAVCPDSPGNPDTGDRVLCTEDASSTGNIVIRVNGFDITTEDRGQHGVAGQHFGTGDIDIRVTGGKIKVGKDAVQNGDNGEAWGIAGLHERNVPGRVSIDASGVDIDTKGTNSFGVYGLSRGPDGVRIRVRDSAIDTTGYAATAIYGRAHNAAPIDIRVTGGSFRTEGQYARGVRGTSYGTGDIVGTGDILIDIRDAAIVTSGESADGVLGWNYHNADTNSDGLIDIALSGRASVTTRGGGAHGVFGLQDDPAATKDVRIFLTGQAAVRTTGGVKDDPNTNENESEFQAYGVHARNDGTGGVFIGLSDSASVRTNGYKAQGVRGHGNGTIGAVDIRLSDSASVGTEGELAHGVYGWQMETASETDVRIFLSGRSSVRTGGANAYGVYADNDGTGDIFIVLSDSASVRTTGAVALGVRGLKWGNASGDIAISVADRASVMTSGAGADGIRAAHVSGNGTMTVGVGAGASVSATGADASGIQFGRLSSGGAIQRAAKIGEDGYRQQTATVNGSVMGGTGDAAGVYLSGGGRVFIGPKGTVGADSGVAVWARRKLSTEDAPALHVGLNPGGRRMAAVLDGGWILNDGGETTVVMNGVTLHDGKTGATGDIAPNGAWNVTLRKAGVKVTDTTTPGNFRTAELASGTVLDRDFSAADFTEVWASRAAVYEALPGFLLRLDGRGGGFLAGAGGNRADAPLWGRVEAGSGSLEAERATVGADYDFDRYAAETGWTADLGGGLAGSLGLRLVSGSGGASAPTGGGGIDASGHGLAAGLSWRGEAGLYGAARASATRYELDLSSSARGALAHGVGATVLGWGAEAGRRVPLADGTSLTVRGWLAGAEASADGFADAAGAEVRASEAGLLAAGLGGTVETVLALEGGRAAALRGSLGMERALDGGGTVAHVSGEALRSKAPKDRLSLALEAALPLGGGALHAGLAARGAGSGDEDWAARLGFRMAF